MTDTELDALEAITNAATEGPWESFENSWSDATVYARNHSFVVASLRDYAEEEDDALRETLMPDALFIAAARTAVPKLIAEVRRLRAPHSAQDRIRHLERILKRVYEESGEYWDAKNHWHDCEAVGCLSAKGGTIYEGCCPCTCWRWEVRDVVLNLADEG